MLFPALYELLLEHFSWRQALFIVSAILLNLVVCGALIKTRSSVSPSIQTANSPTSCLIKEEPTSSKRPQLRSNQLQKLFGSFRFLRNPSFLVLFFSAILDSTAISTFFTFVPTYLKESAQHLGPIYMETLIVVGAVSVGSRLLVALMNNQLLPRWVIFVMTHHIQGIAMLCFVLLPPLRSTIIFSATLYAISAGVCTTLLCCVCQDVCGEKKLTKVFGYSMFAWGVGSTAGPSIAGLCKRFLH